MVEGAGTGGGGIVICHSDKLDQKVDAIIASLGLAAKLPKNVGVEQVEAFFGTLDQKPSLSIWRARLCGGIHGGTALVRDQVKRRGGGASWLRGYAIWRLVSIRLAFVGSSPHPSRPGHFPARRASCRFSVRG